jgi:histidinol-phosphate aminotransferase
MFDLNKLIRKNIKELTPYSSARDDFKGKAGIFLDANENSLGSAVPAQKLNRYPDPLQSEVKKKIGKLKGLHPENIFIGNGSDEAIDILIRTFCNPAKDSILIMPPTYGMYEVAAQINDTGVVKVNLKTGFKLNYKEIRRAANKHVKLIFVCSPNNPTGTITKLSDIEALLKMFPGIVIVDEAYIDFADSPSALMLLNRYPNLAVLQTFSKAWGLAGLRVGMAFASPAIVNTMNKIKAPYNVGELPQRIILQALHNSNKVQSMVAKIKSERALLVKELSRLPLIKEIIPSEANFLLVKTEHPASLYNYLSEAGVVVRNRSAAPLCAGALRITVGTPRENKKLISLLKSYKSNKAA